MIAASSVVAVKIPDYLLDQRKAYCLNWISRLSTITGSKGKLI